MAALGHDEHLELYHRTTRARAEQVTRTGTWPAGGHGDEVIASTHRDGQAGGAGDAIVALRIPPDLAREVADFSDGEQDHHLHVEQLRPAHVALAWDTDYLPSSDTHAERGVETSTTGVTEPALLAEPEPTRVEVDRDADAAIAADDFTGIIGRNLPVAGEPEPPQVDLHLGEAVYRQAAARAGFTPESVAAAEVTIEQAVTRQATSNAARLHALADQVSTAAASRGPAPTASATTAPGPTAPPPRVEVARARAVSAQIWDDTRDEYDPPAQTQRR
ncbi:MAG: hypothetical protein L0H96_20845 [Humibacillus sp.]|nr:hypothetical protein [Humibacillus sp.]MDN5779345.1 hypothetical protein [Humibacillus sp.]